MKVLVTGATGLVGNAIALGAIARGDSVRVLVRDRKRGEKLVPGAEIALGDVTEPATIRDAMKDVKLVFHCAGMPEQWLADEGMFDRVNRDGTRNVLEAALEAKVDRAVYTSTMDVFAAENGARFDETRIDPNPKHTAYERSKQAAEREADAVRKKGLDVVYVNPSGVYGPGPVHVALNSYFIQLMKREAPLVPPGGLSIVYVDGCTGGHLAAAERGKSGERYLLSDTFVTMAELAKLIGREAGCRVPPTAPYWLLKTIATVNAPIARWINRPPLIAHGQLTFLMWSAHADSSKAQREIGFTPTPVKDGVKRTVAFLRAEGIAP
jgi:dihydroflavonol-4-reductase